MRTMRMYRTMIIKKFKLNARRSPRDSNIKRKRQRRFTEQRVKLSQKRSKRTKRLICQRRLMKINMRDQQRSKEGRSSSIGRREKSPPPIRMKVKSR
jgi:hypothetical protein